MKSTGVFGVNKEHIVSPSFWCRSYGTWESETHWKATLSWGVSQSCWTETFFVYIKAWIIFFPLTWYTLLLDKIWESFFFFFCPLPTHILHNTLERNLENLETWVLIQTGKGLFHCAFLGNFKTVVFKPRLFFKFYVIIIGCTTWLSGS